jgi:hypothetical protein
MHAAVKALLKDKPFFFKRVRPGRFSSDQPGGKWVMDLSWSVKKSTTFLPLKSAGFRAADLI